MVQRFREILTQNGFPIFDHALAVKNKMIWYALGHRLTEILAQNGFSILTKNCLKQNDMICAVHTLRETLAEKNVSHYDQKIVKNKMI